jgi:hypothetical protein
LALPLDPRAVKMTAMGIVHVEPSKAPNNGMLEAKHFVVPVPEDGPRVDENVPDPWTDAYEKSEDSFVA